VEALRARRRKEALQHRKETRLSAEGLFSSPIHSVSEGKTRARQPRTCEAIASSVFHDETQMPVRQQHLSRVIDVTLCTLPMFGGEIRAGGKCAMLRFCGTLLWASWRRVLWQ